MIEAPSQVLNFEEIDYKEIEVEEVSEAWHGGAGLCLAWPRLLRCLPAPLILRAPRSLPGSLH